MLFYGTNWMKSLKLLKDIHNSWLYCFTNPPEPSSGGLVKQYNQELCISSISRCFTKRLQSRPLNCLEKFGLLSTSVLLEIASLLLDTKCLLTRGKWSQTVFTLFQMLWSLSRDGSNQWNWMKTKLFQQKIARRFTFHQFYVK